MATRRYKVVFHYHGFCEHILARGSKIANRGGVDWELSAEATAPGFRCRIIAEGKVKDEAK